MTQKNRCKFTVNSKQANHHFIEKSRIFAYFISPNVCHLQKNQQKVYSKTDMISLLAQQHRKRYVCLSFPHMPCVNMRSDGCLHVKLPFYQTCHTHTPNLFEKIACRTILIKCLSHTTTLNKDKLLFLSSSFSLFHTSRDIDVNRIDIDIQESLIRLSLPNV